MMVISNTIRKRLEIQGFVYSDNLAFQRVIPWLRFTPAAGMIMVAFGTALASPLFLLALVPIATLGAILPVHPVDLLYNYGLRYITGTGPLPRNSPPRRFSFGVAAVWLITISTAFYLEATFTGYILGFTLMLIPAVNVFVPHFCILALIYRTVSGRRR